MEFVEYYRIIRRRIWLVILTAGLAAAAVVGLRLLPEETVYPADGRVLLHDLAMREVVLQGNDLYIQRPEPEGRFWGGFNQFVSSRYVLEVAASDIGLVLAEAEDTLDPAHAEPIPDSDVALIVTSARGVPSSPFNVNASSARDLAVQYCASVMENLDDLWKQHRLDQVDSARELLEERLPEVQSEVDELRSQISSLTAPHGGVPPTTLEQRLTDELASLEAQVSATEISQGDADARAQVLGQSAQSGSTAVPGPQPVGSPERGALQQAIVQKQIALEEELTRRTAEHADVKAIEQQIAGLRRRLAELPAEGAPGTIAGSPALRDAAVQAEVEAAALNRRLDMLAERANGIRTRLPRLREDARKYEDLFARLESTREAEEAIQEHLDRLDNEKQQITAATLVETISPATARRIPSGLAGFLLKLLVAMLAGAALGILLVLGLYYVDFSFQDEDEAEMLLDVPVLAGIPRTDIEGHATPAETAAPVVELDEDDEDRGIL